MYSNLDCNEKNVQYISLKSEGNTFKIGNLVKKFKVNSKRYVINSNNISKAADDETCDF